MITFERDPDNYKHWKLDVSGNKATVYLDVSEKEGIRPGYELKLNSYDLGVDIELNDITQRIRFEYPQVKVVVITSSPGFKPNAINAICKASVPFPHGITCFTCRYSSNSFWKAFTSGPLINAADSNTFIIEASTSFFILWYCDTKSTI